MIVRTATRSVVAAAVVLGIPLVSVLVVGPTLAKDCQYGTPGCPYPPFGCKSGEKPYNFGVHNKVPGGSGIVAGDHLTVTR